MSAALALENYELDDSVTLEPLVALDVKAPHSPTGNFKLVRGTSLEFGDPATSHPTSNRKSISPTSLIRARQIYMAISLASPKMAIPNTKLDLIRKLGWLLILFQILDGAFTLLGISIFGSAIEGNPIIKHVIEYCGPGLAIGLIKLLTIIIIFSICIFGCQVKWLTNALRGVAGVYFIFALVPWSLVFSSYYLGY